MSERFKLRLTKKVAAGVGVASLGIGGVVLTEVGRINDSKDRIAQRYNAYKELESQIVEGMDALAPTRIVTVHGKPVTYAVGLPDQDMARIHVEIAIDRAQRMNLYSSTIGLLETAATDLEKPLTDDDQMARINGNLALLSNTLTDVAIDTDYTHGDLDWEKTKLFSLSMISLVYFSLTSMAFGKPTIQLLKEHMHEYKQKKAEKRTQKEIDKKFQTIVKHNEDESQSK